jgi:polysaccharide pyruvyl transferase WcaK-like protein
MRIIVDNGAYTMRNMGDVAMLQVATRRIRRLYPAAEVLVLTNRPDLLQCHCPGTLPLSAASRNAVFSDAAIEEVDEHRRTTNGRSLDKRGWKDAWRTMRGRRSAPVVDPREFTRVFDEADMLVVAGGGFLNDLNIAAASTVLRMARDGIEMGKRLALLSQGLGPVEDSTLLSLLSEVCGKGAYIGLREPCRGPAAVIRAGAWEGRWAVTGDDALELAYGTAQARQYGLHMGFSIRQIAYSGIEAPHLDRVARGFTRLRACTGGAVSPLPISFNDFENDPGAIERIAGKVLCGSALDNPYALAEAAGKCRIVVAGAYHAAVFALAQGVPCLCFHASRYYRDKMEGLAAQFGDGCAVVDLENADAAHEIEKRGLELWRRAEDLREPLRLRAAEQLRSAQRFCQSALSCAGKNVETMVY